MGNVLARFKKKKDTKEVLESIEEEIMYIENMTSSTSPISYYKIILNFALLYGLFYILYYFGVCSKTFLKNNYIMGLLAASPIVALYYYKFDVWYYNRKIVSYKKKLLELRSEKKKILDEVMEKETFKVAKEILEKYAPHQLLTMTSQNFINQRVLSSANNKQQFSASGRTVPSPTNRTPYMSQTPAIVSSSLKPRLTPRPIIPRDRSILDRVADIVLGDGPQNRYALICKTCGSHNGMARKEEFDYLAYRCAYCSQWNPSPKPKPLKPQLAISYNKSGLTEDNHVASTGTIEEIPDSDLENDSNTNQNERSESKDDSIIDDSGPTIEEMEDVHSSENPSLKNEDTEKLIDKSIPEAAEQ